jgi:hypothetical protein
MLVGKRGTEDRRVSGISKTELFRNLRVIERRGKRKGE